MSHSDSSDTDSDSPSSPTSPSSKKLVILNGRNYADWEPLTMTTLQAKGADGYVTGEEAKPTPPASSTTQVLTSSNALPAPAASAPTQVTAAEIAAAEQRAAAAAARTTASATADAAQERYKKRLRKWREGDAKAKQLILERLDTFRRQEITTLKTMSAKEIWDQLANKYGKTTVSTAVGLIKTLVNARFEDGTTKMDAYVNLFVTTNAKLQAAGDIHFGDKVLGCMFLASFDRAMWGAVLDTVAHFPQSQMSFEVARTHMTDAYNERKEAARAEGAAAAHFARLHQQSQKGKGGGGESYQKDNNNRGKGERCNYCRSPPGQPLHTKPDCYSRPGATAEEKAKLAEMRKRAAAKRAANAASLEQQEDDEIALTAEVVNVACNAETVAASAHHVFQSTNESTAHVATQEVKGELTLLFDSGATHSFAPDRSVFSSYTPVTGKAVRVADGRRLDIVGSGVLHVSTRVGGRTSQLAITAFHVPAMNRYLLSIGSITDKGHTVTYSRDRAVVRNQHGVPLAIADRQANNTYQMQVSLRAPTAHSGPVAYATATTTLLHGERADGMSAADLWHRRYAHSNDRLVRRVFSERLVNLDDATCKTIADSLYRPAMLGLPTCTPCLIGKAERKPFNGTGTRATRPLELVHTDLCGQVDIKGGGAYQYMMVLVDDFTRYAWVYPLKHKKPLTALQDWKAEVETAIGLKVANLRSDGGGEYTSDAVKDYCKQQGIHQQLTTAHSSQQNGVAERRHGMIMNTVRTLRTAAGTPAHLWSEQAKTAVYIQNRSPTAALRNMTPYQGLFGKKPDISTLRAYGCRAIVYLHPTDRPTGKLTPTGRTCTLIGYSTDRKAWRVWDQERRRVIETRDVEFIESTRGWDGLSMESAGRGGAGKQEATPDSTPAAAPRPLTTPPSNSITDNRTSPAQLPTTSESAEEQPQHSDADRYEEKYDGHDEPASQQHDSSNDSEPDDESQPHEDDLLQQAPPPRRSRRHQPSDQKQDEDESGRSQQQRLPITARRAQGKFKTKPPGLSRALWQISDTTPEASGKKDVAPTHALIPSNYSAATVNSRNNPSYRQAMEGPDRELWLPALKKEYDAHVEKKTFTLVPRPPGAHIVPTSWVLRLKSQFDPKGRIVIQGNHQKPGTDYNELEISSPVVDYQTLRTLLALAAHHNLEVDHMDVSTAYLNADLKETVYARQPPGFVVEGKEDWVWRLNKSIYGLKQAGYAWHKNISATLKQHGFIVLKTTQCVYMRSRDSANVLIALYVDDLFLFADSRAELNGVKAALQAVYKMKDLGELTLALGLEVKRDRSARTLTLSQKAYTESILQRAGLGEANPQATPMEFKLKLVTSTDTTTASSIKEYQSLMGEVQYLVTGTRPDIAHTVSILSRFSSNPDAKHWAALKRLLRYLRGTTDLSLVYRGGPDRTAEPVLTGFSDSDYAWDDETARSMTGYVFQLCGSSISWQSKRQATVATSTSTAEYVALSEAAREAAWLRAVLGELGYDMSDPTAIFGDNAASVLRSNGPQQRNRDKHINVRHHYIREQVEEGAISVTRIGTGDMAADILTKSLARDKHVAMVKLLGMAPA